MRIELMAQPWQGCALPLSDARLRFHCETTLMFGHQCNCLTFHKAKTVRSIVKTIKIMHIQFVKHHGSMA